jgi:hypothetical protein
MLALPLVKTYRSSYWTGMKPVAFIKAPRFIGLGLVEISQWSSWFGSRLPEVYTGPSRPTWGIVSNPRMHH